MQATLRSTQNINLTLKLIAVNRNNCTVRPIHLDHQQRTLLVWRNTFLLFLPVLNHPLPLELFVYLRLIIGILSLRTFAHLTVLSLSNPALNLTFSLLPITSSHPHASASDSTFDYWRYINIRLTLTLTLKEENVAYLFMRRRKALSAETASCVLVIIASRCKTDLLTVITSFAMLTELYRTSHDINIIIIIIIITKEKD